MPRSTRSADVSHLDKKGAITKASGSTNITPDINLNPSIADEKNLPAEGGRGLNSPVG